MGLFGKLFSKKTDPELERLLQKLADASAESKKPQGPQGLAKCAVKGAEMRRSLFRWLDEFEADTGRIGGVKAADGFLYHPQLIEWFQKRQGLPESKLFLESLISVAFPTPEKKRQIDEQWPAIVAGYQGKPNTDDTLGSGLN